MTKAQRVAAAIKRVTREHGAPNTISPGELSDHYVGLTPLEIGLCAWEACLLLSDDGYGVTYSNRAFRIASPPVGV
jgi:hypothetical protein